jgi:hypothetical protein
VRNHRRGGVPARRFVAQHDVPYPNVLDARDAPVRTALQRSITANATPTTVILDQDGRVAARILGAATSTQPITAIAAAS